MADIKKVVPEQDYAVEDFLSTDYQSTGQEQIVITESVNYVKVTQLVKQVTEQIAIQESTNKAQELVKTVVSDTVAISESTIPTRGLVRVQGTIFDTLIFTENVVAVLSRATVQSAPSDTITITEQINWLLEEGPAAQPISSAMYLSPAARKRFPKYKAPELVVQEEKPKEIPPLVTKVTSSRRFVYSISDAQIFQDFEQIKSALEQIKLQKAKEYDTAAKPNKIEQELVEPVVAKDDVVRRDDSTSGPTVPLISAPSNNLEQAPTKSTQQKVKIRSALKMQYDILRADEKIKTKFVSSTLRARYDIKDRTLHQKLIKMGKLMAIMDRIDALDSIDI